MTYNDKYIIRQTSSFEKELEKIYLYITFRLKEPKIAKKIFRKVKKEIYSLQYSPERYTKIFNDKNTNRNIRRMLVNKYLIIYEVDNNTRTSIHFTYIS